MFKKQLSILFIICLSQHSFCFIDTYFKLAQKSWKLMLLLNDAQFSLDTIMKIGGLYSDTDAEAEVVRKLTIISNKLDDLRAYTRDRFNNIELLINALPDEVEIRAKKRDVVAFIARTNEKWDTFLTFIKHGGSREAYSFLTRTILTSIGENLAKFRSDITPTILISSSDLGLFKTISKDARAKTDVLCDQGETYHHILLRLYQVILITEIKAHTLLTFAYSSEMPGGGGNLLFDTVKRNFRAQFLRYLHEFKGSLANSTFPYLRACDPKGSWRRDDEFIELDGFIQRTVYRRGPGCFPFASTCSLDAGSCSMVSLSRHSRCTGELYDCSIMHKPFRGTDICVWSEGPYKIRYIEHGSELLGVDTASSCPAEDFHVFSQWDTDESKGCFCECQCKSKKWQFAGFPMQSKVDDNYVIVGLRLKRSMNYICFQIAEGKLGPNGYISDFSWVHLSRVNSLGWPNERVWTLSTNRKTIFFDDLQLPPGYILTGIRFVGTDTKSNAGIGFQLQGMTFDYETGELDSKTEAFVTSPNSRTKRELTYTARNSITMKPLEAHVPDSRGYDHIKFRQSDRDIDFGQSTLPLLDGVPIMTNPLSPIGGVGIFHKGYRNYAGFLSLRLYPMNYTYFINSFFGKHDLSSPSIWDN